MTYSVELRSLAERVFSCTCTDFRINGLGTCKHVEAVLLHLEARFPKIFAEAQENGSDRIDVVWDSTHDTLGIQNTANTMPETVAEFFDSEGLLRREHEPEEIVEELGRLGIPALRISQEYRTGSNIDGDWQNASFCDATMRRKCRPEFIRNTRRICRCFHTSAKE